MKRTWCVLVAALLVVLPLRIYSAFFLVDPQTGFYTDGGKLAGIAAAVVAVGIIALLALGWNGAAKHSYAAFRSPAVAVFAVLAGIFAAGAPFMDFAQNVLQTGKPDGMNAILAFTGVLAAIAFFAAAYDFGTGENFLRKHPLVALFPTIWGCLFFISLFISYSSTVNRFDNIYHTFTVAFLLLFLFSQAKLLSGVDENAGRLSVPFGFAAVVLILTDAVPNLVLAFSGRAMLGSFSAGVQYTNLALAAYILAYLAVMCRRREAPVVTIAPAAGKEDGVLAAGGEAEQLEPEDSVSAGATPEQSAGDPDAEYISFLQSVYQGHGEFQKKDQTSSDKIETAKS